MTNEQINIVIAESVGWHPHPDNDKRKQKFWTYGGDGYGLPNGCSKITAANPPIHDGAWENILGLPDYCNDLNAMHEAEKVLTDEQSKAYTETLWVIVKRESTSKTRWQLWHATADQRAEAFLKTIGKWKE